MVSQRKALLVPLRPEIIEKLRLMKRETGVPIGVQLEQALNFFWSERNENK